MVKLIIEGDMKQIRAAAYLAIFHIGLIAAAGRVNGGGIPFAATRALKARLHKMILENFLRKVTC